MIRPECEQHHTPARDNQYRATARYYKDSCPYCEIDRLKAELEEVERLKAELANANRGAERNANINRQLVDKNIDVERQLDASHALLAEARAENERLNSVDHYACALCPDVAQARQETAREIMQMIDVDITNSRMWVNEIRDKFKLEG